MTAKNLPAVESSSDACHDPGRAEGTRPPPAQSGHLAVGVFSSFVDAARRFRMPDLPGTAEYIRQQQAIEERALWLRERRPVGAHDARLIARFVLGAWAERYPVQRYDLGPNATLSIADWLSARALPPTDDRMHDAFSATPEYAMARLYIATTPSR